MTALIRELINKSDTFELVRDKVALIIAEESAQQQALAASQGFDCEAWRLRVFTERTNPWEFLRTEDGEAQGDTTPVVSVWFDSSNTDTRASQTIDRQQMTVVLNIDVYGTGVTQLLANKQGQEPGDEEAAREAQRGARLVRNIIMSDSYVTLGFPRNLGLVGQRHFSTIQAFQPESGGQNARHVMAVRLSLTVKVSELSPQTAPVIIEEINSIVRNENGELIVDAIFQTTP